MDLPQRKDIRLKNYDYSNNGYYFITICTHRRKNLLSEIAEINAESATLGASIGRLSLSASGLIAEQALFNIEKVYPNVFVDEYVIMPNHIHMILVLYCEGGRAMLAPTIPRIIQQYKGFVVKHCKKHGFQWQKSYYEHIIRTEDELYNIRKYITENPLQWQLDEYYTP